MRYATDKAGWELFNAELVPQLSLVDDDLTHADLDDRTEQTLRTEQNF